MNMIDVSSNNHPGGHPIDWREVAKSGVRYAMIKATEGSGYVNPWLDRDAHGARAAGIATGYYHFAQPGQSAADTQADHLVKTIEGLPRSIGIALDIEVTGGKTWLGVSEWCEDFLARIPNDIVRRYLYTTEDWLNEMPNAPFGAKLWIASWARIPRRHADIWQYSGTGTCTGVIGPCDLDHWFD